jgi:hypothetical protein
MRKQVEEFNAICMDDNIRGTNNAISIYGNPFHRSKQTLVDEYLNSSVEVFLNREQFRSCGNYLLFDGRDPDSVRIITSPGYCSGYLYARPASIHVSTLLTNILDHWHKDGAEVNGEYLKYFLDKQRPVQGTPFANVQQLRPATSYKIESGDLTAVSSYLNPDIDSSLSVEQGMRRCAASLSGHNVSVMFSGGLDSLSWYLILASELGADNVDLVTVDWRPESDGQGPFLARPVADNLGIDLEVVSFDDGWLTRKSNVVNHISNWMRKDLTIGRNPNHALVDLDSVNDIVINLTNNESLVTLQMNHLYREKFINKNNSIKRNIKMIGYMLFKQYFHNIPYTSKYMRNQMLRLVFFGLCWPFARVVNSLYPGNVPTDLATAKMSDINLSGETIGKSILGKKLPNLEINKHAELIESEVEAITNILNHTEVHHLARQLYYYAHMAYPSNTLEKLPLSNQGARTYLPTTWGPMLPSLFDDLSFNDAVKPRQQLLNIVELETGRSFTELRPLSEELKTKNRVSTTEYRKDVFSSIILKHGDLLSPEQSLMLQCTTGDTKRWYKQELNDSKQVAEDGHGSFWSVRKISRMVNLELLLRHSIN